MKICKICKFLRGRSSDIPYTSLIGDDMQSCSSETETNEDPSTAVTAREVTPTEVASSELPLPSPFQEIKMLKKPKGGKLTSLGIISIGMSLAGLVVLVDHEGTCEQTKTPSLHLTAPQPPRSHTV